MRIQVLSLLVASLFVASGAMAKICKTVGPDGTVTYTDRPGADACADTNATAAPPKTEKAPAPNAATKQENRATPPNESAPAVPQPASASEVEKSVIAILGLEDLVQRSYDFCVGVQPSSAARYGNAADAWRERNAAATVKMRRALAQTFNGTQQKLMLEGVKSRNQQQLAPVLAGSKASQIKWCDQTANEIDSRALDAKSSLTTPLSGF
jgi:hypothetical protein